MSKRANKKKRPNKQRQTKRSSLPTKGLVLVEALPEHQPSGMSPAVSQQLQTLGLPEAPVMEVPFSPGQSRYFAAHQFPGTTTDCKLVVTDDTPLVFLHGTDCNMVQRVAKDIRTNTRSPFEFCNRRLAGGAFETIDLAAITTATSWRSLQPMTPPPGLTCPDCAAVVDPNRNEWIHEPTCPLATAQQRIVDEDRDYFESHPGETTRVRPPVMAEVLTAILQTHGSTLPELPPNHHWEPGGTITVVLLADGVRARHFKEALAVAVPDN